MYDTNISSDTATITTIVADTIEAERQNHKVLFGKWLLEYSRWGNTG